jgi:hypothetical protein
VIGFPNEGLVIGENKLSWTALSQQVINLRQKRELRSGLVQPT